MKVYLLAFCASLFILCSTNLQAEKIVFFVQVENATEPHLGISFRQTPDAAPKYFRNNLRENGEAVFELNIPFEQLMTLHYGQTTIPFYIKMTDKPSIRFDAQDINKTLNFSGAGAEDNNFMANFNREFRKSDLMTFELAYLPYEVAAKVSKKATTHTDEQFFRMRDEQLGRELQYIVNQENRVNQTVLDYYRVDAKYNDLTERLTYFVINQDYRTPEEIEVLKKRWELLDEEKYKDEYLLDYPAYRNFLAAALQYHYLPSKEFAPRRAAPLIYDLVAENFDRKAKSYLQATLLTSYINRTGDPSFGQDRYADFQKRNNCTEYRKQVEAAYGNSLNTLATASAPQLFFETENGQYKQLLDYKGKVVYLSFWASWCKPCLKNFQKSEKTRKQLQDMGVVLLNVSIDETEGAYRSSLARQPILGLNVLASDLDETKISYQLSSIPAYYIIDKEGRFTFLPQSNNRDIVAEFRKLVEE